jgi:dynein heavy chain
MAKGDRQAMAKYNEQQVRQLTRLIEVTRTNLPKSERQKVMNMITIDAHSRDIVGNIVETGSDKQDCFLWMCQLRSYWDASINDCRVRICDASFPYGYEYLGNGPRLVITPLTGATARATAASRPMQGCGDDTGLHTCSEPASSNDRV